MAPIISSLPDDLFHRPLENALKNPLVILSLFLLPVRLRSLRLPVDILRPRPLPSR